MMQTPDGKLHVISSPQAQGEYKLIFFLIDLKFMSGCQKTCQNPVTKYDLLLDGASDFPFEILTKL
jgi:hypothetical protein